ncbi:MAG TPA: AAA family ATPase [Acidobacteriaceae bacterium]|nr:AAA family ATPase [Acidobacteriaceae bacterium]
MRLVSLTIKNFRSITAAHKLHFGDSTVLIGPNNEGKSNILRALVTALRVLSRASAALRDRGEASSKFKVPTFSRIFYRREYSWESDFPIPQRNRSPDGKSEFALEFEFDDAEIAQFKRRIGVQISGRLTIKIALGRDFGNIMVSKQGPAARELTEKSGVVAQFIARRVNIQYIPAVRTERAAHTVVDDILRVALEEIESSQKYVAALKEIEKLQAPVLSSLSRQLKSTLITFLPAVRDVKVRIAREARTEALRSSEIIIDDGIPTHLKYKGDGVQSLVALALMGTYQETSDSSVHTIVAIEEPESHLHPSAIHSLRGVLADIATRQQIVLTTHCPLFVDRSNVSANILVKDSKARSASSVQEIRDILGVRAADNLRHAELVLLVEGGEEKLYLEALLPALSPALKQSFENRALTIDSLNGGSNLAYKAGLIIESLCSCHCFIDNDKAGKDAVERARLQGAITDADVNWVMCPGMPESELEDLFEVRAYSMTLQNRYRVTLETPKFRTNKKWSDRMKETFQHQGKLWDERVEADVKGLVAEAAASDPVSSLNSHKRGAIDGLIAALELRLRGHK